MGRALPVLADTSHRQLLRGECSRCVGLCCVALAFDRGKEFAFDKPANEPCRYLDANHRCGVHRERAERGLEGCVSYDCYGAGQAVTEHLFPGESPLAGDSRATRMLQAFRSLRRVHALRFLLHESARFADGAGTRIVLLATLEPPGGIPLEVLDALDLERIERDVGAFLRGFARAVR